MWTDELKFIIRMFSKMRVCVRKKPRERLNAEGGIVKFKHGGGCINVWRWRGRGI